MFLINWYIFSYKVCLSLSLSLPHFKMVSFPYGDVFVCWKCRQNPNVQKNYFPPAPIISFYQNWRIVCPCYKNVKWQQCKNVPKQFHSTDRAIQIHLISNHFREKEAGKGKRAGYPTSRPTTTKITTTKIISRTTNNVGNISSMGNKLHHNLRHKLHCEANCRLFCKMEMCICKLLYCTYFFCPVQMKFGGGHLVFVLCICFSFCTKEIWWY